jgi:hypothetical protein
MLGYGTLGLSGEAAGNLLGGYLPRCEAPDVKPPM